MHYTKQQLMFPVGLVIIAGIILVWTVQHSRYVPEPTTGDVVKEAVNGNVYESSTDTMTYQTSTTSNEATQAESPNTMIANGDVPSIAKGESVAMTQSAQLDVDESARAETLIAGGCFWCVEADLQKLQGVLDVISGYAGGTTENPTYQNYADGGHREVVRVVYNPTVVDFESVIIYAIKHMDPTDPNGSFGDRGREYAPALYYAHEGEKKQIQSVIERMNALHVYEKPLALDVLSVPPFWEAEAYHQDYAAGALSQLKYKYYRNASGRDTFIASVWGDDTGPTLPVVGGQYDVRAWGGFIKPEAEVLQSKLTDEQYRVTQKNATERAFQNDYWDNKEDGIYVDVVSGEPLFSSRDKFDSGTGWPSFTKPLYPEAVTEHKDYLLIVPRTEIRSRFADSHLGHKFNDAPASLGGIRYCINSASLRFVAKNDLEKEGYGQFAGLFN